MRATTLTRALTATLLIALAALTHSAAAGPSDPLAALLQAEDPATEGLPSGAEQKQQTAPTPTPQPPSSVIPAAVAAESAAVSSQASLASQLRTPVPRVTAAEFEAMVHGDLPVLVEFMAPWCHYCKAMAPLFEEAAVQMKTQPIPTQLVIVDCMIERALCARFHVGGFPSIRLIRKAESPATGLVVFPFEHSRTTLSFLVFCSTLWRTLHGTPYPELDATQAQWMKEAWAAQQANPNAQPAPQPAHRSHHSSHAAAVDNPDGDGVAEENPDRPLGGMPGVPSLDTLAALGKINLGTLAARHGVEAVAAAQAGGAGGAQKPGSIQAGLSASAAGVSRNSAGGFFSSWVFLLVLGVVAFAILALLCARFGPMLRSRASRHHSLQLSKNF